MQIPEAYAQRMRALLGDEYEDYLTSLERDKVSSLRVNTARWQVDEALETLRLVDRRVPWCAEGVYYPDEIRPAKTFPWHAGLIYIQEASAMTPGSVVPIRGGERVLDLCAAPGGKATQTAARLNGEGILYANDISASRAQALLKNLEMSGSSRIFVTAETPAKLMQHFPAYFDVILVDAPCSGEGMIRKDSTMFRDWLAKGPSYYQPIQAEILRQAEAMLRPGGYILYSTCTFSREEDEDNVADFLKDCPDMKLEPIPMRPGFSEGFLPGTIRLWPHHTSGEGHFLALLRKDGSLEEGENVEAACSISRSCETVSDRKLRSRDKKDRSRGRQGGREREETVAEFPWKEKCAEVIRDCELKLIGADWYAIPCGETVRPGIHYLRTGLHLGEWKRDRLIPSQALAMCLNGETYPDRVNLPMEDDRILRYLKGETITLEEGEAQGEEGYILVCAGRFPLGWALRKGTGLKNKYNPGWRYQ